MKMCPYPRCGHVGDFISNAHCKLAHGMSKDALFAKYGQPIKVLEKRKK